MIQQQYLGGFVGLNTGRIEDCHSKMTVHAPASSVSGGFCGENRGVLVRCAAQGRLYQKHRKSGFVSAQRGTEKNCLWIRDDGEGENGWTDWPLSRSFRTLSQEDLPDWDFESTWYLSSSGASLVLGLYDRREEPEPPKQVVEIRTRQQLREAAQAINNGTAAPDTLYRLTGDIDLGGTAWTPMGPDQNQPFQGCFDGNGHRIHNFTVNTAKHPLAGLFGCVGKGGQVVNLAVDCVLLGKGSSAGPLCGLNQGSIINCTANSTGNYSRYAGGLAGQNGGTILRCAAYGRISRGAVIPWWAGAALMLLLCLPLPAYFAFTAQATAQEVFAPIILDPNAKPIDPGEEEIVTPEPEQPSDTSASFIMNAEMTVGTENYAGAIGLRCPTWSTRGFVATVRLTEEDQAKIGYAGEGGMVTLYQSGLIAPGYGIDVITLGPLPDGSRLPIGAYELSVLLEFYDITTNEKSSVNTVVPLEVTVE